MAARVNPRSNYRWNETAGRYIGPNGRFVSNASVRLEVDVAAQAASRNMQTISERLQAGDITVKEWQAGMMGEIKSLHTAEAAAARGGWDQMSQSDWGWTGREIRRQYDYLDRFAKEIESGKQPLNGRLLVRAGMYGQAGRGTFEEMQRRYQRQRGATQERRVLGIAEHCTAAGGAPGCFDLASKGWQPIGTLPRIGAATCRTHCKCHFEYRRSAAGGR